MAGEVQAQPQPGRRRKHTGDADTGNTDILRYPMSQQCAAADTDVV